jgi:hypothetical protein
MKNCLICNVEIPENKKYCSRVCYNVVLKENLEFRNKSNIGKRWEEIMDTKEVLQPSDNGGESTAEIYNMNDRGDVLEVYSNKVGQVENF